MLFSSPAGTKARRIAPPSVSCASPTRFPTSAARSASSSSAARTSSDPSSSRTNVPRAASSWPKPNTVSPWESQTSLSSCYTFIYLYLCIMSDNCPILSRWLCWTCVLSLLPLSLPADYYVRKRKLSKPAGGEESAAVAAVEGAATTDGGDPARLTRRRKKRKAIFVQKKRRSSTVDYTAADSPQVLVTSLSSLSLTHSLFPRQNANLT